MSRSLAVFALGALVLSLSCRDAPPEGGRPAPQAATPLPYSVFVGTYTSEGEAHGMADLLSRLVPDHPAYVVSGRDTGDLYHKVYAGALSDTTQAAVLRVRLFDLGYLGPRDGSTAFSPILKRPLAFEVGDFPTREAAQAQVAELEYRALPAYALAVPLGDGTHGWRVYVGAFADSAQAGWMRQRLAPRGISARLVERVGWPPPPLYGVPMPTIPAALRGCWRDADGVTAERIQLLVTETGLMLGGRSARLERVESVSPRSVEGTFMAEREDGDLSLIATGLELVDHQGRSYLVLHEGDAGSWSFTRCAP